MSVGFESQSLTSNVDPIVTRVCPSESVLCAASLHLREAHSPACRDFKSGNLGIAVWRIIYMRRVHRFVSAVFLTAARVASGPVLAAPKPQGAGVQVRIYDSGHRDYHNWDEHEDLAYGGYLEKRHEEYHAYSTWHHKEQHNYGNWCHSHPDQD